MSTIRKSTKLRTLVFGLGMATLGMVGGATLTAIAGPGARGGMHMPGMQLAHGMARLDLSDAQEQMLDDLRTDTMAEMRAMHQDKKRGKRAMVETVLTDGEVDRTALHTDLDEVAAEKLALAHTFLDRVLDVRDTLTPDQLAELREMAAEHGARREEMGELSEDGEGRRPRRR